MSCPLIACHHFKFLFQTHLPKSILFLLIFLPSYFYTSIIYPLPLLYKYNPNSSQTKNTTKMRIQIYTRVGRRQLRTRGFRLGSNHFSVHRLRKKILRLFGFINRCMQFLCRCPKESKSKGCDVRTDSRRNLVPAGREEVRLRSYMRSNSFYAEAIKDCLEFIKRNSVPLDSYSETSSRCSDRN